MEKNWYLTKRVCMILNVIYKFALLLYHKSAYSIFSPQRWITRIHLKYQMMNENFLSEHYQLRKTRNSCFELRQHITTKICCAISIRQICCECWASDVIWLWNSHSPLLSIRLRYVFLHKLSIISPTFEPINNMEHKKKCDFIFCH